MALKITRFQAKWFMIKSIAVYCSDIYTAFDADLTLEVRGVLLDMSKPFDKVDMKNIIYNTRQGDTSDEALALINSFLNKRFQHVKMIIKLITS